MATKKWFIGYTKPKPYGERQHIYLSDFTWDCDWYWGGGYLGNKDTHFHFDGAFLDTPDRRGHSLGSFYTPWDKIPERVTDKVILGNGAAVWEDIGTFLDDVPPHIAANWWRIKDLFKQFYALRAAAEVYRCGGHCTHKGRNPAELNPDMAKQINSHIETVIIPEIRKCFEPEVKP
jgi:hypothetical protein